MEIKTVSILMQSVNLQEFFFNFQISGNDCTQKLCQSFFDVSSLLFPSNKTLEFSAAFQAFLLVLNMVLITGI